MKVRIGSFLIAAGDRESPSGFTIDQERQVQGVDYIGAPYGAILARGQRRHTIQFNVARLHDSEEIAEAFVLEHADTVPNTGTLTLETSNGRRVRWIAEAVCARVSCIEHIGVHTRWAYTFVGGEVLSRNPDTEF